MSTPDSPTLLSPEELEAALRRIGEARYHARHPFHQLLNEGRLTKGQLQAWALNRYCYQAAIPRKDAALMARCHDAEIRRIWRQRLIDHDGETSGTGGLVRWLALARGLGLGEAEVASERKALPATRFAVDAYLRFVWERSLLEAIASSLTEMFSPATISERMSGMLRNYNFIGRETLAYFEARLTQAPRDVDFALDYVKTHADTVERQQAVMAALTFKCDMLWAMLDALYHGYVEPGHIPPGAFVPEVE